VTGWVPERIGEGEGVVVGVVVGVVGP